jgi:hypothetical protein
MQPCERILQERLLNLFHLFHDDIQVCIDITCDVMDAVIFYRFNLPCRKSSAIFPLLYLFCDNCDSFRCISSSITMNYNHIDYMYGLELSFCLPNTEKDCSEFLDIEFPKIIASLRMRQETPRLVINKTCGLAYWQFQNYIRIHITAKHYSNPSRYMRILASFLSFHLKDRLDELKTMSVELTSKREILFHLLDPTRDWTRFFLDDPLFKKHKYQFTIEAMQNSLDDLI